MEPIAYQELALTWEAATELESFQFADWKKLSGQGFIRFLCLGVILSVLILAEAALAQGLTGFPILRLGSTGREVLELQQLLQNQGYFNVPANGFFDPITQDALIRFQRANGLRATGQLDPGTAALLGGGPSLGSQTIPLPARGFFQREDRGPAVTALQELLQTLGYFRTNPTGFYGPITEDAVRRFQGDRSLTQTGQVGDTTLSLLLSLIPESQNFPLPTLSNRTLSFGDSGPEVGVVQGRLQELGFYVGPINSFFDGNTQQAVLRFQQANRITPTGQVGPTTKAFLFPGADSSPLPPLPQFQLRSGDRGFSVRLLQSFLNRLGYQAGSVDGVFGSTTEIALRRLQEDLRVIPTGAIDESTLLALRNNLTFFQLGQNSLEVSQLDRNFLRTSQGGFTQNYLGTSQGGSIQNDAGTSQVGYTVSSSFANNPSRMLQLQRRLNLQGLYFGPFDGVYNSQMQQGIARARQLYGISAAEQLFRP